MKKLPRNKRGITLVEIIVGVFVLSIFAVGILSLLTYSNKAVANSAQAKTDYSTAIQKLDTIIAAVSNTAVPPDAATAAEKESCFLKKDGDYASLDIVVLEEYLGIDTDVWEIKVSRDPQEPNKTLAPLRGWYITLTDKVNKIEVSGYAAFAQGAFDK